MRHSVGKSRQYRDEQDESEDLSFEAELHERRRIALDPTVEFESSLDIDASYPPPTTATSRRAPIRSGGVGQSMLYAATSAGNKRAGGMRSGNNNLSSSIYGRQSNSGASTPSEPSDMDLSGSMGEMMPATKQASSYLSSSRTGGVNLSSSTGGRPASSLLSTHPSSAYAAALAARNAPSPAATRLSAADTKSPSSQKTAKQKYADSLEEFGLEDDVDAQADVEHDIDADEDSGSAYMPAAGGKFSSAYQAAQNRTSAASKPSSLAPPRSAYNRHDNEEEVSISFDDSTDINVNVSNHTLIKKAQQLQEKEDKAKYESRISSTTTNKRDSGGNTLESIASAARVKEAAEKAKQVEEKAAREKEIQKMLDEEKQAVIDARLKKEKEEKEKEKEKEKQETVMKRREDDEAEIEIEDDYDDDDDGFSGKPQQSKKPASAILSTAIKPTSILTSSSTSSIKPTSTSSTTAKINSASTIDSLEISHDAENDEDAEIERARRLLEEQEEKEAELAAASRLCASTTSLTSTTQLSTQAFLQDNKPWKLTGSDSAEEEDSMDLALRRRQEEVEAIQHQEEEEEEEERRRIAEEEREDALAEERRRRELAEKQARIDAAEKEERKKREAVLEAAVEESYEEEEFDAAEPSPQPPQTAAPSVAALVVNAMMKKPSLTPSSTTAPTVLPAGKPAFRSPQLAAHSQQQPSSVASPAATLDPSASSATIFASALASLDPAVSALVMKAVAEQMMLGLPVSASAHPQQHDPYSTFNPRLVQHHQPIFQPENSRQQAQEAWEKLLEIRRPQIAVSAATQTSPPPTAATTNWDGSLRPPGSSLPLPPHSTPPQVSNLQEMLYAMSQAQLKQQVGPDYVSSQINNPLPQSYSGSHFNPTPQGLSRSQYVYPASLSHYSSLHDMQPAATQTSNSSMHAGHPASSPSSGGVAFTRFVNSILHSDLAPPPNRTHLRMVEDEREALRRLLNFDPRFAQQQKDSDEITDPSIVSASLANRAQEQKQAYLRDQQILNSILRRVLHKNEQKEIEEEWKDRGQLEFHQQSDKAANRSEDERKSMSALAHGKGVQDDGRQLPANDVIRMIEEGYPYAAYETWRNFSSNTLARSVLLQSESPKQQFTRDIVERTMMQTVSELLSDKEIGEMIKKTTVEKLKQRLEYEVSSKK